VTPLRKHYRRPPVVVPRSLRVSAASDPNAVAGVLAAALRHMGSADLVAVGAGAVNQAVKAVIIARRQVAGNGIDPVFVPLFSRVEIDGREVTAIRLSVYAGAPGSQRDGGAGRKGRDKRR